MGRKVKNWNEYPNFLKDEFDCKETGENEMEADFMHRLQAIRNDYAKPMKINSGYRSKKHSVEIKKKMPGAHTLGRAADISVSGQDCFKLIELAIKYGMKGIGIKQKGTGRYLHLDDIPNGDGFPRPTVWSY